MDKQDRRARVQAWQEVGSRITDPWLSALWTRLPNPDTVLRKLGGSQAVFDQLMSDAHVIGELRAVRAGLLGFEQRIMPGGDGRAARKATQLAEEVMAQPPDANAAWPDVIWSMAVAVFRGYAVHDVVWGRRGEYIVPTRVIDRPQRRFAFNARDNALRVLTLRQPHYGEDIAPRQALLTRHMPTFDNPYGVAVFSACLWPYLFKHAGFKFFVQFTEKYGVPVMVGKHPPNWSDAQVEQLVKALAALANNAVGAVEDGVEMLPVSGGGSTAGTAAGTPQERLIRACNLEISKALTSQTLATEVQGQGSRAASETHMQREQSVHVSDRAMVSATLNTLFRWLTDINFGPHVPAPTHHFYEQDAANNDWADLLGKAQQLSLPVKAQEVYERLGLTPPAAGDALLPMPGGDGADPAGQPGAPARQPPGARHMKACPECGAFHFNAGGGDGDDPFGDALDAALDAADGLDDMALNMAAPLVEAAAADPQRLLTRLGELYPTIDTEALQEYVARALFVADLLGRGAADAGQ